MIGVFVMSALHWSPLAGGALRPELDAAGDYVFTNDDPDREAE
ncbi:hypothetical protein [Agromyces sp. CCNWLW203]